jgi:hypothetical protein
VKAWLLPVLHDMLLEGHIERHRPFYFSYAARLAACHQYMDSALRAQCKADAQMIQQAEAAAQRLLVSLPANSPEVRQGRVTFLFDRQLMAQPEAERQQHPWWPVLKNLLSDYKGEHGFRCGDDYDCTLLIHFHRNKRQVQDITLIEHSPDSEPAPADEVNLPFGGGD